MPKIFISYRRSASAGHAGRLYDRLITVFGESNVFLDVEQIPAGETFSSYLLAKIDESDVFLLMLGEGTLDRTVNADDWVRREIAYALQQDQLVVIPVLQDGYKMPPANALPDDIRGITVKNAGFLFHQMFDESATRLIESIQALFPPHSSTPTAQDTADIPIHVVQPSKTTPTASTSETGTIKIHRVGNMLLYRARAFMLKIDGQDVQSINNNEVVMLDVPAGQHTLSVHIDYHNATQRVHVIPEETVSFEVHVRNMGLSVVLERV